MDQRSPIPEEGLIHALFNLFDVQSRAKIARSDFVATIARGRPVVDLVARLGSKVRKAGERLIRALTEEFQEADAPFGCNGRLPLSNFQVIMADYDMPLVQGDLLDLEKRGYVRKDDAEGKTVDYGAILSQVRPKARSLAGHSGHLIRAVCRVQAVWRGIQARREAARRREQATADLQEVGGVLGALSSNDPRSLAEATKGGKDRERGAVKGAPDRVAK